VFTGEDEIIVALTSMVEIRNAYNILIGNPEG
jgi:hypothetical protein